MLEPGYARLMARYNRWMNEKLYACCAELKDAERKRDRGAFFGSIHATLNHLLYGDQAWLARFGVEPFEVRAIGEELHADFEALARARAATDAAILQWADGLTREWLASSFEYTSKVDGRTRTLPAWVLVTHMFNHQTHHRGQLTTLLSQRGIDPGITDLPWLPELEEEVRGCGAGASR